MRVLHSPLLILLLVLFNFATAAQDDAPGEVMLFLNRTIDEPIFCTLDRAQAFYQTLDGFQIFFDELALMEGAEYLAESWLDKYSRWLQEHWATFDENTCGATRPLMDLLRAKVMYSLLEGAVGEIAEIPADEAMTYARALEEIDLQLMDSDEASESELELNRLFAELPRCSVEQALAFYETLDGYTRITSDLGSTGALWHVDSDELVEAVFTWAESFDEWRREAWSAYYEAPCGGTQIYVFHLERRAYLAALLRGAGADPSAMLANTVQVLLHIAEYDKSLIDSVSDE
ncbi:MAG: hypothetical protein OXG78_13565 [Chloroflexi bacterium]|nr:hypothetical protein [Chloroflexota bacterium]